MVESDSATTSIGDGEDDERKMKLAAMLIDHLAFTLTDRLVRDGWLVNLDDFSATCEKVQEIVTADLEVEDKLNDEVREILLKHDQMLRVNDITYHEMFKKIKNKLVRDRKLIL